MNLAGSRRISEIGESRRISQDLAGSQWISEEPFLRPVVLQVSQRLRHVPVRLVEQEEGNLRQSRAISSCRLVEQEDDDLGQSQAISGSLVVPPC